MYAWIWRHLPGPLAARLLQSLVLFGVVVTALFLWVFPRIEGDLPYNDVTVPGPSATGTPAVSPSATSSAAPTELPAG